MSQNFSFQALTVWDVESFEDISTNHYQINEILTEVFVEEPLLHRVCSLLSTVFYFCRTQEGPAYTWLFNFRSDRATDRRSFVSRDQILVPTHSLRDKGTKGQHRNIGTKGQQRNKGTTQEHRNKGTKEQRNKGTKEQNELGNLATW